MPLANEIPREEVVVEGLLPDGTPYTDIYFLRGALGHYDMTRLLLAGVTVNEMEYFNKKSKQEGEQDGQQEETKSEPPPNAGMVLSDRNMQIIKTWLIGWSHDAPLMDENIQEITPTAAKAIIAKIKSIKEDAQKSPFRGESGSEGLPGDHHPGEGDQQLDDLHPKGAGIEGAQLASD